MNGGGPDSGGRVDPSRVRLRPAQRSDIDLLLQFQNDPESNAMAGVYPRDEGAFRAIWDRILVDPSVVARVVTLDGQVVGSISRFLMEQQPSIGYWIVREQWGRGIAGITLGLFLRELSERPVFAQVRKENAASVRVLTKHGFRVERCEFAPGTDRYVAGEVVYLRLD